MTAARKNSSACRRSSRTVAKVRSLFVVFASFLYDHDKLTAIAFFVKTSWGRRRRPRNRLATCDKKRRREGKKVNQNIKVSIELQGRGDLESVTNGYGAEVPTMMQG